MEIKEVRKIIEGVDQNKVEFDRHFYRRLGERPINEGLVRSFLSKPEKIEKIERGKEGENRFKVWYTMSRKY
ncbi:MAG: hypothetical protein KKE05_06000, partial [Nanoarchaeota archaeon]|nr:hypothetical protein [Nanoarchaeota archaeon]